MRASLATVVLAVVSALAALVAGPARTADYPYVPVTAAEKKAMRPLVDVVLVAHRRGEWWRVCAIMSERRIRESSGTRERCRSQARRTPGPSCKTCTYRVARVLATYRTAADRARRRKTAAWLIAVRGDPLFKGQSELELRFVPERGRWALDDMIGAGSAR
jgi:hypothetical protein